MASIGLVVPVLNNFTGCVEMLQSVKTQHSWTPFIMPQWRKQLPLAAAWNEGIAQVKERNLDYVLVVNDDILFSRYTIDNLVHFFEIQFDPKIVMVTGCNVQGAFNNPHDILTWENEDLTPPHNTMDFSEHPDFSNFMIRSNFCELVGPFDANYYPCWHEDNDMHRRINLLGFKAGSTSAAPYYHYGSVSFQKDDNPEKHKGFENSKEYYIGKWGGYVNDEQYSVPYNNPNLSPRQWITDGG